MSYGTPERDSQSSVAGPPSCASVALRRRLGVGHNRSMSWHRIISTVKQNEVVTPYSIGLHIEINGCHSKRRRFISNSRAYI